MKGIAMSAKQLFGDAVPVPGGFQVFVTSHQFEELRRAATVEFIKAAEFDARQVARDMFEASVTRVIKDFRAEVDFDNAKARFQRSTQDLEYSLTRELERADEGLRKEVRDSIKASADNVREQLGEQLEMQMGKVVEERFVALRDKLGRRIDKLLGDATALTARKSVIQTLMNDTDFEAKE